MKKKFILTPLVCALAYVVLSSYATGPGIGGLGDLTGASGGSIGCGGTGCHAATATATTTISIQLYNGTTLVTGGYTGGTAYSIRITGTQSGASYTLPRFGFQMGVVKTGYATNEGTLAAITGTHMGTYSGINIIEHSDPILATTGTGTSGTTYVLNIPWTAPAAGTGSVTVYTALNAVNYNGLADAGDHWNNASQAFPEATVAGVGPIMGTLTVCTGATTPLTDGTMGGTWSSTNTAVATVGATGTVGGVAQGTATISYTVTGSGTATAVVTVNTDVPAAIAGPGIVCVSTHIDLTDALSGGVWSSTTASIATASSASGLVYGAAVGIDTIKYTISNSCGTMSVSHEVTVRALGSGCVSGVMEQNPRQTELKVFPNPSKGSFTVNLLSLNEEQAHIAITSMWGMTVKEYTIPANIVQEMELNLPAGVYFVRATTLNGAYEAKIVIQ